jgi:hypothetical protein
LALVLLVATGLLTRSLLRVNAVDTGINPEQLVAIQIPMPRALYRNSRTNTSAGGFLVEFDSRFSDLTERLRGGWPRCPAYSPWLRRRRRRWEERRGACCSARIRR